MRATMWNFVKIGQTDAEILRFYCFPKWRPPPSWISKIQFLAADTLERPNVRKPAKFHQYRPIRCWDMANFRFFKMAAVRHFGFVVSVFGPPTKSTWWSLSLCKNCWNRCTGFDNMQVLWFCALGLKTPIHAPKIGVLGLLTPKWAQVTTGPPKGTSLSGNTSYDV